MPGRADPSEAAGEGARTAALDDGAALVLRPSRPGDEPLVVDGFERCSAATRYARFLTGGYRLTHARVHELTGADQVDHVVRLALRPGGGESALVGLARFLRLADRPDAAEVAFIVADEYQGRGVGRLLFDELERTAPTVGVSVFVAEVLAQNAPMKALLLHRGAVVVERAREVLVFELPVGGPAASVGAPVPGVG